MSKSAAVTLAVVPLFCLACSAGEPVPARSGANATASASATSLIGLGFGGGPGSVNVAIALAEIDGALWPQADLDAVVPLRTQFLQFLTDRTGLGGLGTTVIGPKAPERRVSGVTNNPEERWAVNDAIIKASHTRAEIFAAAARRDLRNSDFLDEALAKQSSLRGVVVHVEGTLRRAYPQTVPAELEMAGISKLFEGWVVDRASPRKMWYVLFTDLPEEIAHQTNDNLQADVEFDGYYLKVMTYESMGTKSHPNRTEEAVVVVGRTPIVKITETEEGDPWKEFIVPGITGFVFLTLGLVGFLTWSYYRGDRKLKTRLEAKRPVTIPDVIPGQLREEAAFDSEEPSPAAEDVDFSGKSLNQPPSSE